jgi:hypothetical protein
MGNQEPLKSTDTTCTEYARRLGQASPHQASKLFGSWMTGMLVFYFFLFVDIFANTETYPGTASVSKPFDSRTTTPDGLPG